MEDSNEFEENSEQEESREAERSKEFESNGGQMGSRESEERFETESDSELDREFEQLAELDKEKGSEGESDRPSYYAERFYELSDREFESESELNTEIDRLLDEMEREYFFGKLKKFGKRFAKKAFAMAKNLPAFQAVRAASQLARGNLKGMLGSLAKSALPMALSAFPGGAAALPILKAMGFEAGDPDSTRNGWRNFVETSQEAYEYLASNITEKAVDPVVASQQASLALKYGLGKVQSRRKGSALGTGKRTYRIRVKKGQRIRVIIEGV
jgi:hypothetical protein